MSDEEDYDQEKESSSDSDNDCETGGDPGAVNFRQKARKKIGKLKEKRAKYLEDKKLNE